MAQASAEKLEHTGPAERKKWPQCHRVSSWQERQSHSCQKEKILLSKVPNYEGRESQDGREPHLGKRKEDQSETMRRRGWTPQ